MNIAFSSFPESDLLVLLYYRPLGMIRGRSITISHDSAYIDTNRVRLNKGEEFEIAILYPNGFIRRLNCTVASSNEFGTMLNFAMQQPLMPTSNHKAAIQAA